MARIVVGVDGSPESLCALRWAVDEARLRGAKVEAVHAYDYEPPWRLSDYAQGPRGDVSLDEVPAEWQREAAQAKAHGNALIREAVRALGAAAEGVEIEPHTVLEHRAARALVERSRGADALVVGSRGRGGFSGLVLGSVSQQVAQHADCPVVIIRAAR